MDSRLRKIEQEQMRIDLPRFHAGDLVDVHMRIVEGEKERIQVFRGTILRKRGSGINASFTVRKVSGGIGVERIFPLHSPSLEKIEVVTKGKVHQSRIYFLRDLKKKAARLKTREKR